MELIFILMAIVCMFVGGVVIMMALIAFVGHILESAFRRD